MGGDVVQLSSFHAVAVQAPVKETVSFSRAEVHAFMSMHSKACVAGKAVDYSLVTGADNVASFAIYRRNSDESKSQILRVNKLFNTLYKGLTYAVLDDTQTILTSVDFNEVKKFVDSLISQSNVQVELGDRPASLGRG